MELLIIRNRKITAEDLPVIQAVATQHWSRGRTHISRELCKHWNWIQPSGRLKDMACRELRLTLYRKGLIDYPPPQYAPKNVGRTTAIIHVDCCHAQHLLSIDLRLPQSRFLVAEDESSEKSNGRQLYPSDQQTVRLRSPLIYRPLL